MATKYELYKSTADRQYYFRLRAANGEPILKSEGYLTKAGAMSGITSVKRNSASDANYERKVSSGSLFYFVLRAGNNQIIGTSQMYSSPASREAGIQSVKINGSVADVEDQT